MLERHREMIDAVPETLEKLKPEQALSPNAFAYCKLDERLMGLMSLHSNPQKELDEDLGRKCANRLELATLNRRDDLKANFLILKNFSDTSVFVGSAGLRWDLTLEGERDHGDNIARFLPDFSKNSETKIL